MFVQSGGGGATDGGGARGTRGPQSVQSVPRAQLRNSEPGPPSSQSPSEAQLHVSPQRTTLGGYGGLVGGMGGDGGVGGGGGVRGGGDGMETRGPQSMQSEP